MFLVTNGSRYSGFDKMYVVQSMDSISDHFHFESFLINDGIKANDDVSIYVSDKLKIKGRIDYFSKKRSSGVVIKGKDLTGILINAYPAGEGITGEFKGVTVKEIMTTLCAPFNITVSGEGDDTVKLFNYSFDTKIIDIIAHLCNRYALLASSDDAGNIVLSNAESATDSGISITEGENIHDCEVIIDLNKRFSEYIIHSQNKFGASDGSEKVTFSTDGITANHKPFVKISDDQYEIADAETESAWRQKFQDGISVTYMIESPFFLDVAPNQLINVDSDYLGVKGQLLVKDVIFKSVKNDISTVLNLVSPSTYGGQSIENELIS